MDNPEIILQFLGENIFYSVFTWMISFFSISVAGALLIFILKEKIDKMQAVARESDGKTIGIGLFISFIVTSLIVFFALTIIGIPLSVILGFVSTVAGYAAASFVAYLIGKHLIPDKSPYLFTVLGALIVATIISIPFIGWIASVAIISYGLGAFAVYIMSNKKKNDKTNISN